MTTKTSKLVKNQEQTHGPVKMRPGNGYGNNAKIRCTLRYDDRGGNGHNAFFITGEIFDGRGKSVAGGCIHDEIVKHFPQFAHLVKWHLCSSDGPMHYVGNTVYNAGDKDCNGKRSGDPASFDTAIQFADFPILYSMERKYGFREFMKTAEGSDFEIIRIDYPKEGERKTFGPKYTLGGAPDKWHQCPFDTEDEGLRFLEAMKLGWKIVEIPTSYSEGKARDLDAARNSAIWPNATDEELTAPGLEERLKARLPDLLTEFRLAMESIGFEW